MIYCENIVDVELFFFFRVCLIGVMEKYKNRKLRRNRKVKG